MFHLAAILVAALGCWQAWIRSRKWAIMRCAIWCACLVPMCFAAIWLGVHVYTITDEALADHDSDAGTVPISMVDERLALWLQTRLPPGAHDVRVVIMGGPDPGIMLRFSASPDEVAAFANDVRRARGLEEASGETGAAPHWMSSLGEKGWWQPRTDVIWWNCGGHGMPRTFLQADKQRGTLYLAMR